MFNDIPESRGLFLRAWPPPWPGEIAGSRFRSPDGPGDADRGGVWVPAALPLRDRLSDRGRQSTDISTHPAPLSPRLRVDGVAALLSPLWCVAEVALLRYWSRKERWRRNSPAMQSTSSFQCMDSA